MFVRLVSTAYYMYIQIEHVRLHAYVTSLSRVIMLFFYFFFLVETYFYPPPPSVLRDLTSDALCASSARKSPIEATAGRLEFSAA